MPSLDFAVVKRDMTANFNQLVRRKESWPHRNPGVMVVFCVVFVIAAGLIFLFFYRKMLARRARKGNN
jgi:hypothetical protein